MVKLLRLAIVAYFKYDGSMPPLLLFTRLTSEAGEQQQDITHTARGHTAIILKISYDSQPH